MDFRFTDGQLQLQKQVSDFCTEYCTQTVAKTLDEAPSYPDELHQALCEQNILGHCLPKAYGGNGGGFVDLALIAQTLGGNSNVALNIYFVNMAVATLLLLAGTDDQREQFLRPLVQGEFKACFSLTEPGAGSDAGSIQCHATRHADNYILNGTKLWATGANDADSILVVARTSLEGKASGGTSLFLVPADSQGLVITPLEKLAGNAIQSCKLEFNDVNIKEELRIGPENKGWSYLGHTGGVERLTVAAGNLGSAEIIFDLIKEFAQERHQFGKSISSFQTIQHQLVDMATEIEAMRWLIYSTAWKLDQGEVCAKEVSMAKLYSSERLNDIVMRGMRIFGGRAYQKGHPMERAMRESILSLYAGGTAEIQRNTIAKYLGI